MAFNANGDFCVGSITIDSDFQITVPDYGVDLPECHSSGPIIHPYSARISTIVNWLERDININFVNKVDAEKVFYFLAEYNKYVKELIDEATANNSAEPVPYKLATKALDNLMCMLKWDRIVEDTKVDKRDAEINPFRKKKRFSPTSTERKSEEMIYKNENVKRKFNKNKPPINPTNSSPSFSFSIADNVKDPTDIRMYDTVGSLPQQMDFEIDYNMDDIDLT